MTNSRRKRCRGGSALEMAFLLPWFIFLYVGAFDWGFYSHALISTENAARVTVLYTSTSDTTTAVTPSNDTITCNYALGELSIAPNVAGVTNCSALPVIVTYGPVTGADGEPASKVGVTYQTVNLIPIPGLLAGQATFYREVQMRLRT